MPCTSPTAANQPTSTVDSANTTASQTQSSQSQQALQTSMVPAQGTSNSGTSSSSTSSSSAATAAAPTTATTTTTLMQSHYDKSTAIDLDLEDKENLMLQQSAASLERRFSPKSQEENLLSGRLQLDTPYSRSVQAGGSGLMLMEIDNDQSAGRSSALTEPLAVVSSSTVSAKKHNDHRPTPSDERSKKMVTLTVHVKLRKAKDYLKEDVLTTLNRPAHPSLTRLCLYPGSRFTGEQRSGRQSYSVSVVLKEVDLSRSHLSGYLNIKGLTDELPELTTFFEAEIIGPRFPFLTRKWDATEHVDRQHWMKFPAFRPYENCFNDDGFEYDFMNKPQIFMRWKEQFLVPDHRIRSLNGASFAGFYYVCCDLASGAITGYYFHQNSELFQHLILRHHPQKASSSFAFR